MSESKFEKMLLDTMNISNKEKVCIDNRDELLLALHYLQDMTIGQIDRLFCNQFLIEMVQLLVNAVNLYELGYFDCAFYSIRQSSEVANTMLYIVNKGKNELKRWDDKERFPMNQEMKQKTVEIDKFYSQVKKNAPEFFEKQEELIKKSQKIIHKQGFNTFYHIRNSGLHKQKFNKTNETNFFIEILSQTICTAIVLYIITDPISLVLTDDNLSDRFNFDPMSEPADIRFLQKHSDIDIVSAIKTTDFYVEFSQYFLNMEKMLPATFDVVRNQAFNICELEDIDSQRHLISFQEKLILDLLLEGLQLTHVYSKFDLLGYMTSIKSKLIRKEWNSSDFDKYYLMEDSFNLSYNNIFISVVSSYEDKLILEHNEPLSESQIKNVKVIFKLYISKYNELLNSFNI